MVLNSLKIFLCFSLLLTNSFSFADNSHILCPETNLIRQNASLINQASQIGNTKFYCASTQDSVIFDRALQWILVAEHVFANSLQEAIQTSRKEAALVNDKKTNFAYQGKDGLVCAYGPGKIFAVVLKD